MALSSCYAGAVDLARKFEKASRIKIIFLVIFFNFLFILHKKKLKKSQFQSNETKLTDLDRDCVLLIFDLLAFDDLLHLAQINEKFSPLAADVYRRKYSHLPLKIEYRADFEFIVHHKDEILLGDYNSIMSTMKYFGHVIKSMKFGIDHEPKDWKDRIGNLISMYLSETPVDITFERKAYTLLDSITNPLVNVETVRFKPNFNEFETPIPRFGDIFPSVRRLYLNHLNEKDVDKFDIHMPHLQHISFGRFRKETRFPGVISKNPQIRSISLDEAKLEFLQKTNSLLLQLETLRLEHFKLESESIQFENVKTFEIAYGHTLANLHFPLLRTLYTEDVLFAEQLTFLNEHNKLNRLHLKYTQMVDLQFHQLTANLNDLEEVTLEFRSLWTPQAVSTNAIIEFLERHEYVKQFSVLHFPERCIAELQERMLSKESEWNTMILDDGLSIQRKNV